MDWQDIPEQQASSRQRQSLYLFLIRDPADVKDFFRMATAEEADAILKACVSIKRRIAVADAAGWEQVV